MIRRRLDEGARVARELGEALRTQPFRVALTFSAAMHLGLLLAVRLQPAVSTSRPMREMVVRIGRLAAMESSRKPSAAARVRRIEGPAPEPRRPPLPSLAAAALPRAPVAEAAARPLVMSVPESGSTPTATVAGGGAEAASSPASSDAAGAWAPPGDVPVASAGAPGDAAMGDGATMVSGPSVEGTGRAVAEAAASAGAVAEDAGVDVALLAELRNRIDARKIYPQLAVRNGWEGRVLVEIRIEEDGRLADLRLLQGSGYAVLDEATLSAVRRAAPYPRIGAKVTIPVEYRLIP